MKRRVLSLVVVFLMFFSILSGQPAMAEEDSGAVANPAFTVQYYANLEVLSHAAKSGYHELRVIDASDGLPANEAEQDDTHPIYLKNVGNGKWEMATETVLTEVYTAESFEYKDAPSIYYFDKLAQNGNYILDEIWMLKDGKSSSSTKPADWDIYDAQQEFHFTNRPDTANDEALQSHGFILIEDNDVIRLVYETANARYSESANLYDYDISDGNIYKSTDISSENTYADLAEAKASGKTYYMYTAQQGINSNENYSGKGTKLAFGNVNTRTGLGKLQWKDSKGHTNTPNQANYESYGYCTFGLTSHLDPAGNIVYSNGIVAPKLFEEGDAAGKRAYNGGVLEFRQNGDTFTLSGVSMTSTDGTAKVPLLGGLEQFINPSPYAGKVYDHIFTNNFWVMDKMSDGDFAFGHTDDLDTRWCYGQEEGSTKYSEKSLPQSDDGQNHNSYFGMSYTVEFGLSEDYVGPLEWVFYGDDDLWVFLDGQLICDIGGVHSSVGQYVNMKSYLEAERQALMDDPDRYSSTHTLKIFYTERGASGSTCYMRFSLPSVSIIHPISTTGQLKVSKDVLTTGTNGLDQEFDFTIRFKDASGQPLMDDYVYDKYKVGEAVPYERDLVIWDNGTFSLKDDEYIIIKYLPGGTTYSIEEEDYDDYTTSAEGGNGTIVVDQTQHAHFTNIRKGTITVSKTVEGNREDKTKEFTFQVILDDTSINGTFGDMTFVNGVAEFTLKDGESKTADRLPIGIRYTVVETLDSNYDTTWEGQIEGTIEAGGIYRADFTNSRRGNLTVEKNVVGDTDKYQEQRFRFTVTLSDTAINGTYGEMTFIDGVAVFTLKNGESKTALELPAHITYTVEETPYEHYETTIPNNASGEIVPAETSKVVFVNTRKQGDLLVTKVVSDNAVHKNDEFTFVVTLDDTTINGIFGEMEFINGVAQFTLKHGESKKAEGIPVGTAYVVTETENGLYIASYENAVGQIIAEELIAVTVTNDHKLGGLSVEKTVTGTAGERNRYFNFSVVLSDTSINGTYGEMTFVDGVAQFILKHGEKITAEGLLAGISYEVIEGRAYGYRIIHENATGTIPDEEIREVKFYNHKDIEPPKEVPKSPPTGDNAPVAAWFATALVSMAVIWALVWKKRRQ